MGYIGRLIRLLGLGVFLRTLPFGWLLCLKVTVLLHKGPMVAMQQQSSDMHGQFLMTTQRTFEGQRDSDIHIELYMKYGGRRLLQSILEKTKTLRCLLRPLRAWATAEIFGCGFLV